MQTQHVVLRNVMEHAVIKNKKGGTESSPSGKATSPFSSTKVEYACNNSSAPLCLHGILYGRPYMYLYNNIILFTGLFYAQET